MDSAELLLHPVRLRVVQAFLGGRELTTGELRELLPGVPPATLYRQVAVLADAGVLEVVGERRARGATERTYALHRERGTVDPAALARMGPAEHRAAFTTFVASLLADFDRYLAAGDPDLVRDVAGYRQAGFHASDDELVQAVAAVNAALAPYVEAPPAPGRRRRVLTTVLLPDDRRDAGA